MSIRNVSIDLYVRFLAVLVLGSIGAEGKLSTTAKGRSSRAPVWVLLILPVVICLSAGQARAQAPPGAHGQKKMARAVDRTLREGVHANLPPHLSTLLGLSQEKESPVMQSVLRTEKLVQGFDVSVANKSDVVLFIVNESTKDQTLYLTSAEGRLRKVVSVEAGVGEVRKITDADKRAFEKEKQFWLDRLAPVGAPK